MVLTHYFCLCIMCGETIEIFSDDEVKEKVLCTECGYTNDIKDSRLKTWTVDF